MLGSGVNPVLNLGGRRLGSKYFDLKNLDSFTQFHKKKSIFQGKFPKILAFFR